MTSLWFDAELETAEPTFFDLNARASQSVFSVDTTGVFAGFPDILIAPYSDTISAPVSLSQSPGDLPLVTITQLDDANFDNALDQRGVDFPDGSFTFEMLVQMDGTGGSWTHTLANFGAGNTFRINATPTYLDVFIGGERFDATARSSVLQDGDAHRLSVTWQSDTGEINLYIDGVLASTGTVAAGAMLDNASTLTLGAGQTGARTTHSFGDVRLFDGVRDAADIQADYDSALTDPTTIEGLVGYWTANGGTGLGSQLSGVQDFVLDTDVANYTRSPFVETGNVFVDGLTMHNAYSDGSVFTYSFGLSESLDPEDGRNWSALNASMEARHRDILQSFTDITGVETLEVQEGDQSVNMWFASRDDVASAYVTSHRGGVMAVYNNGTTSPLPGSYGDHLILHEIGHAFGLAHGHDADALPREYQGYDWSVMSYRGHSDSEILGFVPNYGPETWMLGDVLAIQHQFGANFESQAGDTLYTFNPETGETFIDGVGQGVGRGNYIYRTIWDGNGEDTYDLSNYSSDMSIDLNPGAFSTFSITQLARVSSDPDGNALYAGGNVANAFLFEGDTRSLIENAYGGTGSDVISGNQADNLLRGDAGDDVLNGGEGDDVLIGHGGDTQNASPVSAISAIALNQGVTDQYLEITDYDGLSGAGDTRTLTIEMLVSGLSDRYIPLLSYANDQSTNALLIEVKSTGTFGILYRGRNLDTGISAAALTDGEAHRLSISWDGTSPTGEFVIYVDGVEIGRGTHPAQNWSLNGGGTLIFGQEQDSLGGGFNGNQIISGAVADIRIFDDIRTPEEIAEDAFDAIADPAGEDGLINNWRVNPADTANGTVADLAGTDALTIRGAALPAATRIGDIDDDILNGGQGNDLLIGGMGADTMNGGDGIDTASYADASAGVYVHLQSGIGRWGEAAGDRLTGIENLSGTSFNDRLHGDASANHLIGSAGRDVLIGEGGNDILDGGDGRDVIYAGDGDDHLIGGADLDVLHGSLGADIMDGGDGFDYAYYVRSDAAITVDLAAGTGLGGHAEGDTLIHIERVDGSRFDDVISGDDANNVFYGHRGDDLLTGGAGNDRLLGGLGDDELIGGDGNDTLIGHSGANSYSGGDGTDRFYGGADAETFYGDAGNDRMNAGGGDDELNGGTGDDYLVGADGHDIIYGDEGADRLIGGAGADTLYGGAGNDRLYGGDGDDALMGGAGSNILQGNDGNDTLTGGEGTDNLWGQTGNDTLIGGDGVNYMRGGEGNDTFVHQNGLGKDVIYDFAHGEDVLRLENTGLSSLADVMAASTDFGSFVIITLSGGDNIRLYGVQSADFTEADFDFVETASEEATIAGPEMPISELVYPEMFDLVGDVPSEGDLMPIIVNYVSIDGIYEESVLSEFDAPDFFLA